jgi:hypothetical protein
MAQAPAVYYDEHVEYGERARAGVAVTLGGGLSGFTSDELRDVTTDGGMWAVRLLLGSTSPIAFEASYIGSAQEIEALGLDNDAILVSNGVQGALRLNATPSTSFRTFVFGGVGWRRYDITNADRNTSAIAGEDDVLEFPVGIGFDSRYRRFIFDVRGEFRYASREDMVPDLSHRILPRDEDEFADMHLWGVNATLGYEF